MYIYAVKTDNLEKYCSTEIKYAVYSKAPSGWKIRVKNKSFPKRLSDNPNAHYRTFTDKVQMFRFMIEKGSRLVRTSKESIRNEYPECLI